MPQLFANGAIGTLSVSITSLITSVTLTAGNGLLFPAITGSDYYYCTIESVDRTTREIVKVTARSGDILTIIRGQDSTLPTAFNSGTFIELRLCRASLTDLNVFNYISSAAPLSNGTASSGTSLNISRDDHIHPHDTAKASTSGSLVQFTQAGTSSSDLRWIINDETGSGVLVFNTSPTLVTPILGTPTSGNLANCVFPTLNQNTTGNAETASSCSGNSLTSTSIGTLGAQGSLAYSATHGFQLTAKVGSTYDFSIFNPANSGYIFGVPTGTSNVVFGGLVTASTFVGALNGNAATATYATRVGTATYEQGGLSSTTTQGTVLMGKTGSIYDFSLINPANNAYIFTIPTNTNNVNFQGAVSASSFTGALHGIADTATLASYAVSLVGDRTNWSTNRSSAVANMLGWKNYGNGHVIFDASQGTSPDGTTIDNSNAQTLWIPSYPSLMGWNGTNTFGLRVDSSRNADHSVNSDNATNSSNATNLTGGGTSRSIYSTVVGPTNPMHEIHKPGVVAYAMYINNANQWAVAQTQGGGVIVTADHLTLDTAGNLIAQGDIAAFSDARLKTNVVTIENALNKVCKMRGVEFDKDGKRSVGVIAQEMQQVIPEVVLQSTEYLSVAYGNLVGVLIEAIKELKLEIDTLKGIK